MDDSIARTKVFISYSHRDKKWLERLQVHLKPLEDDGLLDRWDDTRIKAGDDWRQEIQQALAETRVAILLVSADFLASDFIRNDELPPLLASAEDEGVVILPVILSPSQYPETRLGRFQAVNDLNKPLIGLKKVKREAVLVEVANRVKEALNEPDPKPPPNDDTPPAKPWNIPKRNRFFTGRKALLDGVRAALENQGRALLSGLGGMGKTQIAIEYAHRHRDDYNAGLWVIAETETALTSGFAGLAKVLNLPQQDEQDQAVVVEAVKAWLAAHAGWLLVFDSANEPAWIEPLWPEAARGHILVTTRARQAQRLGFVKGLPTQKLPADEAAAFLLKRTGRGVQEEAAARALAKDLGFLPLALEQAAAYLVDKQASFANYRKSYQKLGLDLLEKAEPISGGYRESVAKTWLLNFEQVETTSAAAADALRASAFLAPDNIPLELFTEGAAHLGPALANALADAEENPLVLDEVLEPLTRYSLIRREGDSFSIHGLVQDVARASLAPDAQALWKEHAIRAVNAAFPGVEFATWPRCERLLPHAQVVIGYIESDSNDAGSASRLLNQTASYLQERAKYAEAELLLRRTLSITEHVHGPDHADTASCLNNLALLLKNQGQYAEAKPLYQRALDIYERVLGPDHPYTASSLNNLAALLYNQSQYAEAASLFQRALAICERVLGPDHPDTARSLNNFALLLDKQGQYAEAAPLFRRALDICERVFGPDHPYTATTLNNLAGLFDNQGRYAEAEPLLRRAFDITERVLGPDHPDTASSLNNLALLLENQGQYAETEPLYRRALDIYERVLGPDHPDTASSLNNLAGLLYNQGQYAEAEPLFRRALDIRERALGPNHPYTASSLNNLRVFLREQGRDDEAAALEADG